MNIYKSHNHFHLSSVTFLAAVFLFSFPKTTEALVAIVPGAVGIYSTIALGQVLALIALFVCLPIALGGFFIRLIGFKKQNSTGTWSLNLKDLCVKMFSYFIYHFILIGGIVVIARLIQTACVQAIYGSQYYSAQWCLAKNPFSLLLGYGGEGITSLANLLLLPVLLAFLWPLGIYLFKRRTDPNTIAPTLGTYGRMLVWNFFILSLTFLLATKFF